ncbi:hypothetical protein [Lysinibacillus sphaericus]|uniref:hypothetical protein n=1 Tax=Lysinibacillus sphaericus TaxID=1421 RepID=UPI0034153735
MDFVILDDQNYDELTEPDSFITLLPMANKFDYKDKEEVEGIFGTIKKAYPDSKDKVNFVDIQD